VLLFVLARRVAGPAEAVVASVAFVMPFLLTPGASMLAAAFSIAPLRTRSLRLAIVLLLIAAMSVKGSLGLRIYRRRPESGAPAPSP